VRRAFTNMAWPGPHRRPRADALIISPPDYVCAIPGWLNSTINGLVSGAVTDAKPVSVMAASHRGADILASLRLVICAVTRCFHKDIFVNIPASAMVPDQIGDHLRSRDHLTRFKGAITSGT
jgi:hypothetical protein